MKDVLNNHTNNEELANILVYKTVCSSEFTKLVISDNRIATVLKYIKAHLTEKNISIDSLANIACMSSSHFHKQFKKTLGISPIDYINLERIKFSKQLMLTNDRINDIAFKAGFNSVSYFNRQFKKHELIAPSHYKKAINQQNTN